MSDLLTPVWLSLQLAGVTTLILLVLAMPLAWWLARTDHPLRPVIEALTALPLVLPPTVLGFYLLLLFSPNSALGAGFLRLTGDTLAFSFAGLVLASIIYSLPISVQPLQTAFHGVGQCPARWRRRRRLARAGLTRFAALPCRWRGAGC